MAPGLPAAVFGDRGRGGVAPQATCFARKRTTDNRCVCVVSLYLRATLAAYGRHRAGGGERMSEALTVLLAAVGAVAAILAVLVNR